MTSPTNNNINAGNHLFYYYHEAGHAVAYYAIHDKIFDKGAELSFVNSLSFKPGTTLGKSNSVPGNPRLDEAWVDLAGPCAEWMAHTIHKDSQATLEEALIEFSKESLQIIQDETRDDLSRAILMLNPDFSLCQFGHETTEFKLALQTEVFPQAHNVHNLLESWWQAVEAIVSGIKNSLKKKEVQPFKSERLTKLLLPFVNSQNDGGFKSEEKKILDKWNKTLHFDPF
jgi:hypothetical protein